MDRKFFREAPVARDIAHRIAETLRQHCTHHVLPTVRLRPLASPSRMRSTIAPNAIAC